MRRVAALTLVLCLALPALAARKKSQSPTRKPSATSKKSTGKKQSASKAKTAAKRRQTTRRASWRGGQMTPTPERYKEIQQALIDKGYLGSPATGSWGAESTAALRKFQQAQNLEPSGKLDSLTLISLGLGPKREPGRSAVPAPAAPKPTSTPRGQQ